jgi:hypothetical protein
MLLHLRVDGARIAEIERALTIHDTVFRHLLVLHEAGTEIEAVDPDTLPPTAVVVAVVDDADDDDSVADGDQEDDLADAAEPVSAGVGRQTAVAPPSDDVPDQAAEAAEEPATVSATAEEEN